MVDRTAVDVIYLHFSEAFELSFNILADKLPRYGLVSCFNFLLSSWYHAVLHI